MSVPNDVKRARWFDVGAAACARHAGVDDVYACPLCLGFFDRTALDAKVLTFEHAPPKCVGGKAIALTCQRCNSFASHELDPHIERSEEYLDFAFGTTREPMRRTLEVGGVKLRGNLRATGDVVIFEGVSKQNDPREVEAFKLLNLAEGTFAGFRVARFRQASRRDRVASIRVHRRLRHVRLSVHHSGVVGRSSRRDCRP